MYLLLIVGMVLSQEKTQLTLAGKCCVDVVDISGQSYKASTIVIYNSRVVPDLKI